MVSNGSLGENLGTEPENRSGSAALERRQQPSQDLHDLPLSFRHRLSGRYWFCPGLVGEEAVVQLDGFQITGIRNIYISGQVDIPL